MTDKQSSRKCPGCGTSWVGEEIPENIRHLYGDTHWGREIGIDGGYMGIYDGIVAIMCPDCKKVFPRNVSGWALEMFEKYKKAVDNETI